MTFADNRAALLQEWYLLPPLKSPPFCRAALPPEGEETVTK